jgi:cellobiose epimerase
MSVLAVGSMADARAAIERILTQNIVPFWLARLRDPDAPGYRLNHDARGLWKGPAPKRLVKHARVLWFLARLRQSGFASTACDALMAEGFTSLRRHFWDAAHGGFFWELDERCAVPTMPDKHLYGQAQALYGVAQYALVTGDAGAHAFADEIFDTIERRFHDAEFAGYREFFRQDWTRCPPDHYGYLGAPPDRKLLNSHLHLLEAVTVYCRLGDNALARERLSELIEVAGGRALNERHGALTDNFGLDWTPSRGPQYERVSYGHDLEAIHLLDAARRCLGRDTAEGLDTYRRLFENAWRYGYGRDGGVYDSGPLGEPADDHRRIWWGQAEALLGALTLYRLTDESRHADAFHRTLDWIVHRQVDWEHGDWHAEIAPDGTTGGDKANAWKGPYHNGRAMIEAIEILDRLA